MDIEAVAELMVAGTWGDRADHALFHETIFSDSSIELERASPTPLRQERKLRSGWEIAVGL